MFKNFIKYLVSFLLFLPSQFVFANEETRSPQDLMQIFVETWNSAKTTNELIALLKLPDNKLALVEKLKQGLKIGNQKLPQAVFDEAESLIIMGQHKMVIFKFAPLVVSIDGKALAFTQDTDEARIDYLIKEFSGLSKKTVWNDIVLPDAQAGIFDFKTMFWIFTGISGLFTVWSIWDKAKEAEQVEKQKESEATPFYNSVNADIKKKGVDVTEIGCEKKLLASIDVKRGQQVYEYSFDTNLAENNFNRLVISDLNRKRQCEYKPDATGIGWILTNKDGGAELCKKISKGPQDIIADLPIETSRSCCRVPDNYCANRVNENIEKTKTPLPNAAGTAGAAVPARADGKGAPVIKGQHNRRSLPVGAPVPAPIAAPASAK